MFTGAVAAAHAEANLARLKRFLPIGPLTDENQVFVFHADIAEIHLELVVLAHLELHAVPDVLVPIFLIRERIGFGSPCAADSPMPTDVLRRMPRT